MAGYSSTPLIKKLGIKVGMKIRLVDAPENYFSYVGLNHESHLFDAAGDTKKDFIHIFITKPDELNKLLTDLKKEIVPNGIIWVSWLKKKVKKETLVSENQIRECALISGLVDVKVCAFDEQWSALKLVIRLKDRTESKT